jgi:UDP-GlcNAc:undecaprenyl-phosphate GlcNAc-1-phosphate transferase
MVLSGSILVWNLGAIADGEPVVLIAWAVPVTIVGVVGMINAVNMIDGLDGLAGSVSLVALLWFAIAAGIIGLQPELLLAMLMAFCLAGFLVFNLRHRWRSRASVFLGDAGSLLLGFCITVLGLGMAGPTKSGWSALALAFLVALPAMDTVSLIVRRAMAGRSPLAADREHLHHLFERAGNSPGQVAGILTLISVVIGGLGLLLDFLRVGSLALLAVLLGLMLAHTGVVVLLKRRIAAGTGHAAVAAEKRGEAFEGVALRRRGNEGAAKG